VGAETAVATGKLGPVFVRPHGKRSNPAGQGGLTDDNKDASSLLVQLTPRPAAPVEVGAGSPLVPAAPAAPTEAPEIPSTNQSPINGSVLENDIAAYRRVTEINPRNDRAWDALGNIYEAASLHKEAIAAFEQAIALAPRKDVYHFHLGIAQAYQMNYEKAIEALENSIALNPNFVLAHCALAANYRRIGKETEAQEHIAVARPSMEYEKEYNRACFESISGNNDEAFALLEKALEKDQVKIAMLRNDLDLDFIRKDARFEALLIKTMSANQ
jgi:tetratricopeptide (TPR) repeat protein